MTSMSLRTQNIQTTIYQLDKDFAGRIGDDDYDATKGLHIHRRNRAFVWNHKMQLDLLDSILKGYYIPPIICSTSIVNNVERQEVMEGGNRMTTIRRILLGKVRPLTPDERRVVEGFGITQVIMRKPSAEVMRVMFRRLNKNVRVSDGQLYAMSEEDSPLVKEALLLLEDETHPLRQAIIRHFGTTLANDNDGKKNLENAVALVAGALYGPKFITRSFGTQEENVSNPTPINRNHITQTLGALFEVFDRANSIIELTDGRKKKGQWSVGKWLGAMLYDIQTNPTETGRVKEKWARYIARVRQSVAGAEDATKVAGAQNLTATRHKKVCKKVAIFMDEDRLALDSELADCVHLEGEEEDDNSSVSDEEAD